MRQLMAQHPFLEVVYDFGLASDLKARTAMLQAFQSHVAAMACVGGEGGGVAAGVDVVAILTAARAKANELLDAVNEELGSGYTRLTHVSESTITPVVITTMLNTARASNHTSGRASPAPLSAGTHVTDSSRDSIFLFYLWSFAPTPRNIGRG